MGIVTENKVLTQEEMQVLKSIQNETQALIVEFGEIELVKIQIVERKTQAKEFLSELTKKEQDFTQSVFGKYGKCTIDPQTGKITPVS